MKSFIPLIAVAFALPILALPPVPASLPSAVHADMEVMTNIGFPAEVAP